MKQGWVERLVAVKRIPEQEEMSQKADEDVQMSMKEFLEESWRKFLREQKTIDLKEKP